MSWLNALAMASSRPSAVESAAARPPAATRPEITYGRPAISGVESTITSVLITKSENRSDAGMTGDRLTGGDDRFEICGVLAADLDQP